MSHVRECRRRCLRRQVYCSARSPGNSQCCSSSGSPPEPLPSSLGWPAATGIARPDAVTPTAGAATGAERSYPHGSERIRVYGPDPRPWCPTVRGGEETEALQAGTGLRILACLDRACARVSNRQETREPLPVEPVDALRRDRPDIDIVGILPERPVGPDVAAEVSQEVVAGLLFAEGHPLCTTDRTRPRTRLGPIVTVGGHGCCRYRRRSRRPRRRRPVRIGGSRS